MSTHTSWSDEMRLDRILAMGVVGALPLLGHFYAASAHNDLSWSGCSYSWFLDAGNIWVKALGDLTAAAKAAPLDDPVWTQSEIWLRSMDRSAKCGGPTGDGRSGSRERR